MNTCFSPPARQRGIGALTVAMLLLFVMTLMALFANRALVVEQRASANQHRATVAFELAEAGLEWAVAMLNDPRRIDASCRAAAGGTSFRSRYVAFDAAQALVPATDATPTCGVVDGALSCTCPAAAGDGDIVDGAHVRIGFGAVAQAPDSVRITANGCSGAFCDDASARDATARVSIVVKLLPLLRTLPVAAITAGGRVTIDEAAIVANTDAHSGTLIDAGATVALAATATLLAPPGSPPLAALVEDDSALARLVAAEDGGTAWLNAFFGMDAERLRDAPVVRAIGGGSASARASALRSAYDAGYSAFVADGPVRFDGGVLGSAARPLLLVTDADVDCSAACEWHGVVHASGNGLLRVQAHGAVVTPGDHRQPAGSAVRYSADVLQALRRDTGIFVKVPGSWSDQ